MLYDLCAFLNVLCMLQGRRDVERYAVPPLPPHLEQNLGGADRPGVLRHYLDGQNLRGVVRDTCYHLLKLYSKRDHRLERSLSPATYGFLPLDYFLRLVPCFVVTIPSADDSWLSVLTN